MLSSFVIQAIENITIAFKKLSSRNSLSFFTESVTPPYKVKIFAGLEIKEEINPAASKNFKNFSQLNFWKTLYFCIT